MQAVIATLSALLLGLAINSAQADTHAAWDYEGDNGPQHWGELDKAYAACSTGRHQSPIDISDPVDRDLPPITFNYDTGTTEIINNGHTVMIEYAPGSTITVDGHTYELKQFHFHAPSEHTVDGEHFPMEAHLVHADEDGNLAVVAVFYRIGQTNVTLSKLWQHLPHQAGIKHYLPAHHNVSHLMPDNRDYYSYTGSLTMPPCTEGVRWLILKTPVRLLKDHIDQFKAVVEQPDNRPVQPLNDRIVVE